VALSLRTREYRRAEWLAGRLDREFERAIRSVQQKTTNTDVAAVAD